MNTIANAYPLIAAIATEDTAYRDLWLQRLAEQTPSVSVPVKLCLTFATDHKAFFTDKSRTKAQADVLRGVAQAFWGDRFPLYSSLKNSYGFSKLAHLEPGA